MPEPEEPQRLSNSIHYFIHLFIQHLLGTYYVLGFGQRNCSKSERDSLMSKTDMKYVEELSL